MYMLRFQTNISMCYKQNDKPNRNLIISSSVSIIVTSFRIPSRTFNTFGELKSISNILLSNMFLLLVSYKPLTHINSNKYKEISFKINILKSVLNKFQISNTNSYDLLGTYALDTHLPNTFYTSI